MSHPILLSRDIRPLAITFSFTVIDLLELTSDGSMTLMSIISQMERLTVDVGTTILPIDLVSPKICSSELKKW